MPPSPSERVRRHGGSDERQVRLPGPIDGGSGRPQRRARLIRAAGALVLTIVVAWLVRDLVLGGDDDREQADTVADPFGDLLHGRLPEPARVLDTRVGETTRDGRFAGTGVIGAGATVELPISGRSGSQNETSLVVVAVSATTGPDASDLIVDTCGSGTKRPSARIEPFTTVSRHMLVPLGATGAICFTPSAPVDVVVDVQGFLDPGSVRPLPTPITIVDTTSTGTTADDAFARIGVRPESSTLRVPVVSRFEGLDDVGALVVSIAAVAPLEAGEAAVVAPEGSSPSEKLLTYGDGTNVRSTAVVPIGPSGELCLSTTGRTDVIVELLGLVPASETPPIDGAGECQGQHLFPDHRVVALYGTARSARLGVLGEQEPVAAAARLAEIAEPWRAGDRPVLPAFELIATLATGTPEERGDYNIRSSPEFVQEYLDVARRHGYYLILDLQPGRSDFLTEAMYYDEFLRQPDVGIALDPEWRVEAPDRPEGGSIGQVDAAEVNAVIDYVARIVAEEGLPEKLVVVHQFQDRMITNRDQLVERPGVALTIHMDGFGSRAQKLNSWDVVRAAPPLHMGLKLFYDEDIDLLSADDVLEGLFQPVPDVITYQ